MSLGTSVQDKTTTSVWKSEAGIGFWLVYLKKGYFLLKFHFVITFCSERVERGAYTGFLSASQELSPLMTRKIIRLAAKKLQHDWQASDQ